MKEPKEVNISMDSRVFTLELAIRDKGLIDGIFAVLSAYVDRGYSLKVRQTYMTSPSDSVKIMTKIISAKKQMDEWRDETKQLLSLINQAKEIHD